MYLIQEYANSFDLACLMEIRGGLSQEEARLIMRQLVRGIQDIQKHKIVHRDMKLANILLHFPDRPMLDTMTRHMKRKFLQKVDLTSV